MIIGTGLTHNLWAKANNHSVWIGARVPSHAMPELATPIKKAMGRKPDLKGLLEWGVPVWVKDLHAGKLDPQAKEGRFIGYDDESKGYCVYWPGKNKVSIECNIYVNKVAIITPGDVAFKGEWEPVEKSGISNPAAPSQSSEQPTTPEKGHIPDASTSAPSAPKPVAKTHHNSLSGLPQYDKNVYG